MTITEAVHILQDSNKLCDILPHTAPAEDIVIRAGVSLVDQQMNRLGYVDTQLLGTETQIQILAAADTMQRAYYRLRPMAPAGCPG